MLHIDDGSRIIDDVPKQLLVTGKGLFGMLTILNALQRPGHPDESPRLVPDRLASRAEPFVFSPLDPEPVFHIVMGVAAFNMRRQSSKHAIDVVRVKSRRP